MGELIRDRVLAEQQAESCPALKALLETYNDREHDVPIINLNSRRMEWVVLIESYGALMDDTVRIPYLDAPLFIQASIS